MISEADRRRLLQLAREAIVAHVTRTAVPADESPALRETCSGAFVTIHKEGDLRGCIGHLGSEEPLGRVVPECAVAACSADPRFEPVSASELPALDIEISVLGKLEPLGSPDDFEIGRHGLVVEEGWHRGLLLPQVATERNWDRETFLAQTCHKAGLPKDAWKHGANVFRFDAEVFGEAR